jgi:hypothetical protein
MDLDSDGSVRFNEFAVFVHDAQWVRIYIYIYKSEWAMYNVSCMFRRRTYGREWSN